MRTEGIEPPTFRSGVCCSTIEPCPQVIILLLNSISLKLIIDIFISLFFHAIFVLRNQNFLTDFSLMIRLNGILIFEVFSLFFFFYFFNVHFWGFIIKYYFFNNFQINFSHFYPLIITYFI